MSGVERSNRVLRPATTCPISIHLIRLGDLEILKRGRRRAVLEIESTLHGRRATVSSIDRRIKLATDTFRIR